MRFRLWASTCHSNTARALIIPRTLKRCKPRLRRCALVHSMLAARLVNPLGRLGAHALAPLPQRLAVAGQRRIPITQLVLGCEHRREDLGCLPSKSRDLVVLGEAPIGQPLLGHRIAL